jgi:hypothetical protein
MNKDFVKRAKKARLPILSPEVWSNAASNMIRMAIFAGFDPDILIIECLKATKGQKVNIHTVRSLLEPLRQK